MIYFAFLCRSAVLLILLLLWGTKPCASENDGVFKYKLETCRPGSGSVNQHIPGYQCPHHAPVPYAKNRKYPLSLPAKERCWFASRPIPAFCYGETLQLQMKVGDPQKLSNKTAIEVTWGIASEAPFFCPEHQHSNKETQKFDCLSKCRSKLPFHSGDSKHSYGVLRTEGDHWLLDLTLRESAGHRVLDYSVISCPPKCKFWFGNKSCCLRQDNFDVRITAKDRNVYDTPVKSIGGGLYNVTIHKSDPYTGLDITDVNSGDTVQTVPVNERESTVHVTLPHGVYQVYGTAGETVCGNGLEKPITLVTRELSYDKLIYESFSKRSLLWSDDSDLPAVSYEFGPDGQQIETILSEDNHHIFSIGGESAQKPAPLEQTFVHRVNHAGAADNDRQSYASVTVNLSQFLPKNASLSLDDQHLFASWMHPDVQDGLHSYLLQTGSGSVLQQKVLSMGSEDVQTHEVEVYGFQPGDRVMVEIGAVYRNRTDSTLWWGPLQRLSFDMPLISPISEW